MIFYHFLFWETFQSYAVLETGGKQYRVKSGDKFEIERLNVEAGQSVTFDKILLINQDGNFKVGTPTVESATVVADVLLHKKRTQGHQLQDETA